MTEKELFLAVHRAMDGLAISEEDGHEYSRLLALCEERHFDPFDPRCKFCRFYINQQCHKRSPPWYMVSEADCCGDFQRIRK